MGILIENEVKRIATEQGRAYPKDVSRRLPYSPRHLRRMMARMAAEGKLLRLGQRGGYMVAA